MFMMGSMFVRFTSLFTSLFSCVLKSLCGRSQNCFKPKEGSRKIANPERVKATHFSKQSSFARCVLFSLRRKRFSCSHVGHCWSEGDSNKFICGSKIHLLIKSYQMASKCEEASLISRQGYSDRSCSLRSDFRMRDPALTSRKRVANAARWKIPVREPDDPGISRLASMMPRSQF